MIAALGDEPMTRDFKIAGAVLLPLAIEIVLYVPFKPVSRQRVNMAIAEEELPRVQAVLDGDWRFKEVTAYVYTGQDGAVGLGGWVEKDEDLFRLMKAVAAIHLRVATYWQVKVVANEPK